MASYLLDVNLPYRFSIWKSADYFHQKDLDDEWTDSQIWEYARDNKLTIISKDSDFSNRIIVSSPPPKVIHLRLGNMRLRDLYESLEKRWDEILLLSSDYKLVTVFTDRVEGLN